MRRDSEGKAQPSAWSRRTVLTGRRCWFVLVCSRRRPSWHSRCFVTPTHSLGKHPPPPLSILAKAGSEAGDQSAQQQRAQVLAALSWTVGAQNHHIPGWFFREKGVCSSLPWLYYWVKGTGFMLFGISTFGEYLSQTGSGTHLQRQSKPVVLSQTRGLFEAVWFVTADTVCILCSQSTLHSSFSPEDIQQYHGPCFLVLFQILFGNSTI